MKLLIERKLIERWKKALLRAKRSEIGGVLFGEHIGHEEFRIVEFTLQREQGDETCFKRCGINAKQELERLSKFYGYDYAHYNYLGEWHSHPNSFALPSAQDFQTMHSLLKDTSTEINFLVLLILRINSRKAIEMSAVTFLASGHEIDCDIKLD